MVSNYKVPPKFDEARPNECWKNVVNIWRLVMELDNVKQALTVPERVSRRRIALTRAQSYLMFMTIKSALKWIFGRKTSGMCQWEFTKIKMQHFSWSKTSWEIQME